MFSSPLTMTSVSIECLLLLKCSPHHFRDWRCSAKFSIRLIVGEVQFYRCVWMLRSGTSHNQLTPTTPVAPSPLPYGVPSNGVAKCVFSQRQVTDEPGKVCPKSHNSLAVVPADLSAMWATKSCPIFFVLRPPTVVRLSFHPLWKNPVEEIGRCS